MFLTEMHFYYHREGDKVCVQNMVGSMCGQYHEHTPGEFEDWKKDIENDFGKQFLHDQDK